MNISAGALTCCDVLHVEASNADFLLLMDLHIAAASIWHKQCLLLSISSPCSSQHLPVHGWATPIQRISSTTSCISPYFMSTDVDNASFWHIYLYYGAKNLLKKAALYLHVCCLTNLVSPAGVFVTTFSSWQFRTQTLGTYHLDLFLVSAAPSIAITHVHDMHLFLMRVGVTPRSKPTIQVCCRNTSARRYLIGRRDAVGYYFPNIKRGAVVRAHTCVYALLPRLSFRLICRKIL